MKKSEYLTIQEFADKVGQSRQNIYKRLSTDLLPYVVKVDKKKMLKVQAFSLFDCKQNVNIVDKCDNESDTLYDILKAELKAKNDLIKNQQETIDKLTMALKNTTQSLQASQTLHAGTIQQQLESKEYIKSDSSDEKKSFIKKWLFK